MVCWFVCLATFAVCAGSLLCVMVVLGVVGLFFDRLRGLYLLNGVASVVLFLSLVSCLVTLVIRRWIFMDLCVLL